MQILYLSHTTNGQNHLFCHAYSYLTLFLFLGSDKLRLLKLVKNLGKGGAVRRGMLVGRGGHLLFADADGATTFSEIAKVQLQMSKIENEAGHGVVCGSRAHLESDSIATRSVFRTILMFGFHFCVSMFGCRSIQG